MFEKRKNNQQGVNFGEISLELIKFDSNIRHDYKEEDIDELAKSMMAYGQLQPICVYKKDSDYFVIFGHRRYLSAKKAGFKTIRAVVMPEPEAIERIYMQIIENEQSKSITPEERESYIHLLLEKGESYSKIADTIGKSESWIRECSVAYNVREKYQKTFIDAGLTLSTHQVNLLRNATEEEIKKAIELSVENPENKGDILTDLNKRTKKKKNVGGRQKKGLAPSSSGYREIIFGINLDKENNTFTIQKKKTDDLNEAEVNLLLSLISGIYRKRGYDLCNLQYICNKTM
jgi:ParB family chromosome partitioning protein